VGNNLVNRKPGHPDMNEQPLFIYNQKTKYLIVCNLKRINFAEVIIKDKETYSILSEDSKTLGVCNRIHYDI
jgi:hypothetical protein